jgi:hypothetical protein
MNVRITAEEMAKLGRSSIKLGDRSGDSLASLGRICVPLFHMNLDKFPREEPTDVSLLCLDVYHQLHCVVCVYLELHST